MSSSSIATPSLSEMMIYTDKENKEVSLPGGSDGIESDCNVGDLGCTPGAGKIHAERNGYPI